MNARIAPLLIAALALALAPSPPARAAQSISRCAGADGASIYTDGSCRAVGAQPLPMSARLVRTLAREDALAGAVTATAAPAPQAADGTALNACARTPGQLASALRQTLGGGDVNDLAGVYDWTGVSGRQSRAILQRLQRMSDRPLLDGHYFAASNGVVQLVQGSQAAPTITELSVRRRAGCLLLAF